jgi:predicted Na+-dependent transporter
VASILLYLSTLLIVFLLTVLIETVALQLALVPRIGLFGLVISFLLSTTIEALVLTRMKRGETGYNVLVALVVNLSSYLILLLPAFLYS